MRYVIPERKCARTSCRASFFEQFAKRQDPEPNPLASKIIETELLLFILQLNLDRGLQRALNRQEFDVAQDIRTRREQVDKVLAAHLASKGPGCGCRAATQTELADIASEGLRLKSEMQRAVEEERYTDAAALRDNLRQIEQQANLAQAQADGLKVLRQSSKNFRLGKRVANKKANWKGVVVGWDESCCEDEEWQRSAGVGDLQQGAAQRWYHVLLDHRDWPQDQPAVAYAAEELLSAPQAPLTWADEHGNDRFVHPYGYTLFLGEDAQGDMLPTRQLRDRYAQQRQDVHPKDDNEDSEPPAEDPFES